MVVINSVSAKGFKSFANKTELVFGKGFNVIIGPNGSGKSNVSDLITFVLGKSSSKDMRAEKTAHLIYNGGKKGSPAKEAEVTIQFDNTSGKMPIQTKEVNITRIVKQSGVSTYKINDEIRTRQQVLDLLSAARLDPDGYNIIGQGDIVGFMEMKPPQRREIIEQISGIAVYEDKKQKCLNELQKVDSKLNETEIILKEREVNLRELKKERDQAIRFKELQEDIKNDKATYVHLQIKDKETKLSEIDSRKKESEDKIQKITKEINDIKSKINDHKDGIKSINEEIDIKGEKDQVIIRKSIEELKTGLVKIGSRIEVCTNELTKLKTRKEELNNNNLDIENKIKNLKETRKNYELKLKTLQKEEQENENKVNQFKQKHGIGSTFGDSLEALDKELDKKLEEINSLNEKRQDIIRQKDQLQYKLGSLNQKVDGLKGSEKEIDSLKLKKKNFRELTEKLSRCLNEDSSYTAQLNQKRHELNQLNEELAKLKARQIGIKERSQGDLAIRKIIELGKKIGGVKGTVSDLGNVEGKYSLALEAAAGARVQSIVVETDIIAQKCIDHLRENKLGMATFLPLNKIKSRIMDDNVKSLLKHEGVHGLALNIIKYEPKYKDIFSYVLGSTLVVEDITNARRIGIGRARMVTLHGDLMEPSGAMIGGYRAKSLGFGFKEKEIDENIVNFEEQTIKLKSLFDHISTKKSENEIQIQKIREEKTNLEADIIKIEKTLDIEGSDIGSLNDEINSLNNSIKHSDTEINLIINKLGLVNKQIEDIKRQKNKLKEKLSNPELSKNLDTFEESRLKLKGNILEIEGSIKNIDMQINSMLLPEFEKTQKIIKQYDKEYGDFAKELNELKDVLKVKENELKLKENEEKKFHVTFRDLIAKRNKFDEKIRSFDISIIKEDERLKSFEQKLNSISIERAKAVAETEALQKEFEQYPEAKIRRGITLEDLKSRIHEFEKELNKIGNVNLRALEVYEEIDVEYNKIIDKVFTLKNEREDVLNVMVEVESKKKEIFMKTYSKIIKTYADIFSRLTTKGHVHVTLDNPDNPFDGGINISIKVAGNKFLDIKSLSGGEKTLSALALIFSIQEYAPSPFYLLDEVDAALDKFNSGLLSKLIADYSRSAQYIVISHNDNIITEAEYVYGVSMKDGVTKVVSLKV